MPEDCIIIDFDFKEATRTEAEKLLADTVFSLQTMHRLSDQKDTTSTLKVADHDTADWDGNVPPDMTDGFDFLL